MKTKTQTNCPSSPLSGYPPSSEKVQSWMDKLTANGITDGVLCRLIHGRDEGKIVPFKDYTINDLGVCIDGGYFLLDDETLKVAEPLFVPLLELTEDVKFIGSLFEGKAKSFHSVDINNILISTINENNELLSVEEVSDLNTTQPQLEFYQFRTAQDLFAWMALNEEL